DAVADRSTPGATSSVRPDFSATAVSTSRIGTSSPAIEKLLLSAWYSTTCGPSYFAVGFCTGTPSILVTSPFSTVISNGAPVRLSTVTLVEAGLAAHAAVATANMQTVAATVPRLRRTRFGVLKASISIRSFSGCEPGHWQTS